LATASPYKFPETVRQAIDDVLDNPPQSLKSLENKPVLHGEVINNIKQTIEDILQ
jgi:threonine synthase